MGSLGMLCQRITLSMDHPPPCFRGSSLPRKCSGSCCPHPTFPVFSGSLCPVGHPRQHSGVTEEGGWNFQGLWILCWHRMQQHPQIPTPTMGWETPGSVSSMETPALPALAQTPPWRPQPLHPGSVLYFPPLDLDVSFQPSVLERIPSAFPRDQPFPNLPCRCSLLSPPLPAFACSFQGLSRFLSLSGISALADKDACWFWAGSASWGG